MCVDIHQSVAMKCKVYLAELARHNYVTPKSYLELLGIFTALIGKKKQELNTAKKRMKSGLDKVGSSESGELWAPISYLTGVLFIAKYIAAISPPPQAATLPFTHSYAARENIYIKLTLI